MPRAKAQNTKKKEPNRRTNASSVDSQDENALRIIKQNLLQSHYTQPELVESLLLASAVRSNTDTPSLLSIEGILSLTEFAKKKKWLCAYGADLIDETHRISNMVAPLCIEEKRSEICCQSGYTWDSISDAQVLALLRDEKQQWDRINLPMYDPEFFEYLHLHPCEELRFDFGLEELSHEDFLHIAKCKDLRLIDMCVNDVDVEDVKALKQLPKLSKIVFDRNRDLLKCFQDLEEFPHLDLLQINGSHDCDLESPAFPFEDKDLHGALSYLSSKKHTTRHLHITTTLGPIVFAALGQFTQVESIYVQNIESLSYTGFDLYVLFMSPSIQKSVRHLHLHNTKFDEEALLHLAKFQNLVSIDFGGLEATTEEVVAIINTSAEKLQSLTLRFCRKVGDGVLEAIAGCNKLRNAVVWETAVSAKAIEKYRKTKRPNWGALEYKEFKDRSRRGRRSWS